MKRAAVALALLALAAPLTAAAHNPGTPTITGYVATVSAVQPDVVGLQARVVLGDQLLVTNRTATRVEILDRRGRPFIRIARGRSRAWHDPRVVGRGEPPPPAPGASETAPRFVKNWRVPGRSAGRGFAITGFLGWVPVPPAQSDDGSPVLLLVGGAIVLFGLSASALYLLGRRRS